MVYIQIGGRGINPYTSRFPISDPFPYQVPVLPYHYYSADCMLFSGLWYSVVVYWEGTVCMMHNHKYCTRLALVRDEWVKVSRHQPPPRDSRLGCRGQSIPAPSPLAESGGWYGTVESSDAVCGPGFVSCGCDGCCSGTCVVHSSLDIESKATMVGCHAGSHSKTSRAWTLRSALSGISLSASLFSECKRVIWSMFSLMMISSEAS